MTHRHPRRLLRNACSTLINNNNSAWEITGIKIFLQQSVATHQVACEYCVLQSSESFIIITDKHTEKQSLTT